MLAGCRYLCRFIIVLVLLLSAGSAIAAEAVAQKATVFGTPTANLRAGAGVEHELKRILKEGDQVTIEAFEGEWYLVTAPDGQQGYIHKNLLKPVQNVAVPPEIAPPQKSVAVATPTPETGRARAAPAKSPTKPPSPTPAAASGEVAKTKITDGQAPSLLQMLEGHELEVKIGLLVAGVAFVIGWFCGGHYYIRREQKHRRRLRL